MAVADIIIQSLSDPGCTECTGVNSNLIDRVNPVRLIFAEVIISVSAQSEGRIYNGTGLVSVFRGDKPKAVMNRRVTELVYIMNSRQARCVGLTLGPKMLKVTVKALKFLRSVFL